MNNKTKTIVELSGRLRAGETTSVELTNAYLERIDAVDDKVNAFLALTPDSAIKSAEEADRIISAGKGNPLTGIPISIKDIFCTKGVPTTCASKILEGFVPPYDATVVEKLKDAGAVILGKTNMDEFAMGSSTENSAYKKTVNPWDISRVPGGSSGGSAASVSARECVASLGTDTGGSIRQPAALCGVVGLKPTYGRVSRFGMIAFASSLDQAGPLTNSVEDSAIILNAIAGHDPKDSTSLDLPVPDFTTGLRSGVKGLKVGIPKQYFIEGIDADVNNAIKKAIELYRDLGAKLVDISLPHTQYAVSVYYLLATAEASSNLARYDAVKYGQRIDNGDGLLEMYKNSREKGFGAEVKRRIMLGTYALSSGYYDAYYKKASQVRTLIRNDFDSAFNQCDVILTPTAPAPAFKLGEKTDDPLSMYLSDIFTLPASLAGLPAISLPCGFSADKLPLGLHLICKALDEVTLLRCAASYEGASEWNTEAPEL